MSKDSHSFSVSIAQQVGVPGAILIQHLAFLQKSNVSGDESWQEKWVRRTAKSMAKTYPYWTAKQISTICDSLEKDEYVFSKIANALKTDRAKSFLLTAKGLLLIGEIPFAKTENGVSETSNAGDQTENDISPFGEMNIEEDCTSIIPSFVEEEKDAALSSTSKPEFFTLEAEKEKNTPPYSAAPPAPRPAAVRLYDPVLPGVTLVEPAAMPQYQADPRSIAPAPIERVSILEEIEALKTDEAAKETFTLSRKIPSRHFEEYVEAFRIDIAGRKETYQNAKKFRAHFFNWCGIRWEIDKKKPEPAKQPTGKPFQYRQL